MEQAKRIDGIKAANNHRCKCGCSMVHPEHIDWLTQQLTAKDAEIKGLKQVIQTPGEGGE